VKITLGMVVYNSGDEIIKTVEALSPDKVVLVTHSDREETLDAVERVKSNYRTDVYDYRWNRGLASSWNEIIHNELNPRDILVISNDDILFGEHDRDVLLEKVPKMREYPIVCASGYDESVDSNVSLGYACFVVNPILLDTVGYFDENIFPAYFEDIDHARRIVLSGLSEASVELGVWHGRSATLSRGDDLFRRSVMQAFLENKKYYIRKWGGEIGHETYTTPFDADFGYLIDWDSRLNPYGLFDRNRPAK